MSDVKQYWFLKSQHDAIGLRLQALRTKILREYEAGDTKVDDLVVHIELRKSKPKIDDAVLWMILGEKNLIEECTSVQLDDNLVKQAFIEGKITDEDLRAFNLGSSITPALSIHAIEGGDDDLQANDEGVG